MRDCAVCTHDGQWLFEFHADENQSLEIRDSTIIGSYVLNYAARTDFATKPLAQRMAYRMHNSIFDLIFCCPFLWQLTLPPGNPVNDADQASTATQLAFHEISAHETVFHYWVPWGAVESGTGQAVAPGELPILKPPANEQTLKFSLPIETAKALVFGKGDFAAAIDATTGMQPDDFVVTSTGPLAELWAQGISCGCDVRKLPTPPAATIEPFVLPAPRGI